MDVQTNNSETPNPMRRVVMWFGWSLSVWEGVFFWVTASAAVLGGLGLAAAFSSAIIGYKISDVVTRESNERIAEAHRQTERLRADNLETEKIIQPREFPIYGQNNDAESITKELKAFAGTKVWIQSVPDFEASRLTVSLSGLFEAVGWNVSTVGPSETGVGPLAIMEGVTVLLRYPYDKFPPPENASPDRLQSAAEVLVRRLQMNSALGSNFFSIHWEFLTLPPPNGASVTMPPPRARVTNDTMLVLVGLKPIGALISEKNAKAPSQQHNK
jgi:hypothetical protein